VNRQRTAAVGTTGSRGGHSFTNRRTTFVPARKMLVLFGYGKHRREM
jgi:hypothetical protein